MSGQGGGREEGRGSGEDRDALIEAAATAYRERDREGRLVPPPAWWDLAPEDREEAYRVQLLAREMERAMDPEGQSATARAVLARLGGTPR